MSLSKRFPVFCLLIAICALSPAAIAQQTTLSIKDFKRLLGCWEGQLTYLDYTSGKPYTMPANLHVKQLGSADQFEFASIYPDEMEANGTDTLTVGDGTQLDGEAVVSKRKLPKGGLEIITETQGNDGNDNAAATLRHTYTIGKASYSVRKDVQFQGKTEWIKRHEYAYVRKDCGK